MTSPSIAGSTSRRLRRVATVTAFVLTAASGVLPMPAAGWAAPDATVGPLIAGTASYVAGTYAWTDYVYDDRGPDTDGQPGGDASYGRAPGNLADLVQVQATPVGGALRLRAVLETLVDPAVPLLGFGIDLDASPATGATTLPGSAWRADGYLGLERTVVVSHTGAQVLAYDGAAWRGVAMLPARIDPVANVVATDVPWRWLPVSGQRVRMVAAAGLGGDRSWVEDRGPIFDLAFVGGEPHRGWQDRHQGEVLSGRRAAAAAVAAIDLGLLRARASRLATATRPGFHTLLYRSLLDLGEGVRPFTIPAPGGAGEVPLGNLYAGPYQPYVVRVPEAPLGDRPPLLVYLHGIATTHLGILDQFRGTAGFDPPAVVVFPLARGETTFYIGAAEQDVLDVADDAAARYGADRDRIALAGRSMGGFGTFRLGVRYPDRWSSMTAFIGTAASAQRELAVLPPPLSEALFPPSRFPSGSGELLENLRNVPVRLVSGQLDPVVSTAFAEHDALSLDRLGYEHRYWALARREHEVAPALVDCLLVEAVGRRRDARPAHVTYAVEPATFVRDRRSALDLRYDGAWWVSGVVARADVDQAGEKAVVDAVSLARPDRLPTRGRVAAVGENITRGADLCGNDPAVRTGDAWRMRGVVHSGRPPQPTRNALRVTVERVAAVRLDLAQAGIATRRPLSLHVGGDGPLRLRLAGAWPVRVAVSIDGRGVGTVVPDGGEVVVAADLRGEHVLVLTPAGDAAGG